MQNLYIWASYNKTHCWELHQTCLMFKNETYFVQNYTYNVREAWPLLR